MLDDHFSLPRTVDRIRGLWLGLAIEQYVDWLADRRCAPCTIRAQVRLLVHFDAFATASGATSWNELPALAAPFVAHWMNKHCGANAREVAASPIKHKLIFQTSLLNVPVPAGSFPANMDWGYFYCTQDKKTALLLQILRHGSQIG